MAKRERTTFQTFKTLDIYLSAFLAISGIRPTLEVNNGKVLFTFSVTEDLYTFITSYNSNMAVKVTDFVTAIKALRGQMLTIRGWGTEGKR